MATKEIVANGRYSFLLKGWARNERSFLKTIAEMIVLSTVCNVDWIIDEKMYFFGECVFYKSVSIHGSRL